MTDETKAPATSGHRGLTGSVPAEETVRDSEEAVVWPFRAGWSAA